MANWCSIEAEIVCFMASFHTKTVFCMTLICPKVVSLITTKKLTTSSSNNCLKQTHKQKSSVKYKNQLPLQTTAAGVYCFNFTLLCLFQPLIIFPNKFMSVICLGGFHLRESFYRQIFTVNNYKFLIFFMGNDSIRNKIFIIINY